MILKQEGVFETGYYTAGMKNEEGHEPNFLIIDCCEHVVHTLESAFEASRSSLVSSDAVAGLRDDESVDLIVVGTSPVPWRRLFLSRLRRFFPSSPILILRRESKSLDSAEEVLRGDFLLSDHRGRCDLSLVQTAREVLPMTPCEHAGSGANFELVRQVTRVLAENFSDSELDLEQVADELSVSPSRLSRILNREVHVSFRRMLRQVRIEEAKNLLATSRLSVKEVAARVGFSDSHYFSRVFKEITGAKPSEYSLEYHDLVLN